MSAANTLVLRFQLRTGVRVASRLAAPPVVATVALFVFLGGDLIRDTGRMLYPAGSGPPLAGLLALTLGLLFSRFVLAHAGATTSQLDALPVSRRIVRTATLGALLVSQAPLVAPLLGLLLVEPPARAPQLAATVLVAVVSSSSLALDYARRSGWRHLGLDAAAVALATVGSEWSLVLAAVCIATALGLTVRSQPRRPRVRPRAARRAVSAVPLPVVVALRALGPRRVLTANLYATAGPLAAWAFRTNNDLPAELADGASRLGAVGGAAIGAAALVYALRRRRPPWLWLRSLPCSARRRVDFDTAAIGLALVPFLLLGAVVDPLPLALAALAGPYLLYRAAAELRAPQQRLPGLTTLALATEGAILAIGTAFTVWLPLLLLLAAPLARRNAAKRDRTLPVGRFHELAAVEPGRGGFR